MEKTLAGGLDGGTSGDALTTQPGLVLDPSRNFNACNALGRW
jgi:hypothetical protein